MNADAIRQWVQFLLLVFAAAWGIYQFVYKEIFVPAKRPATLAITSTLEEIARTKDKILVRARIYVVNRSDIKVYVPALWFTVRGIYLSSEDVPGTAYELPATELKMEINSSDLLFGGSESYSRFSKMVAGEVIATWRLKSLETWYEPKDETTNEELFYVPLNRFSAIHLKVEIIVTKSIEALAETIWTIEEDGSIIPQLMLKQSGYKNDSSLTEPFNPDIPRHRKWEIKSGASQNWSITTLPTEVSTPQDDTS